MNKKTNKEEKWFKFTWLVIHLFIVFWLGIVVYGSSISFLFDQTKGKATITSIQDNGRVDIHYFHQKKNKKIKLAYTCYATSKLEKLKTKSTWAILYSAHFPEEIAIIGVDNKPDPIALILIILLVIPIFFFKHWRFE